mmetsp:Transcript_11214/g.14759  ORF Transcript_11214/g.14759 Transcript_11214/m.14759 type:complete len:573 (-) Transcript_11214:182-1900(-)|eukprot:CAMPEP_0198144300 /NCGR_PEP_ID=MMETSP1443-20131203/14356_1 /TAXON_ID=186043 /ORGANISM="Entomoneis sp., Strain CCMP2396" /LENGTH=572 /DNA_ID=CAMNT_0043807663 /DNA_START=58 /DNA_END=1776 /DNA_ORIENTATION=-
MKFSGPEDESDDDFKSLLARTEKTAASSTNTLEMNLDHLTRDTAFTASSSSPKKAPEGKTLKDVLIVFADRLSAYIGMLCYFYPCICGTIVFGVIGMILFGLGTFIFNPNVEYGVMKHDHSFLDSIYNSEVSKIDHWCLRGDNDSCKCEDPLVPTSRGDRKSWRLAFKTNRKVAKSISDSNWELDLMFLGESVVEEMDGRWMGQGRAPSLVKLQEQFQKTFDKTKDGGKLNAAALGIAGDTAPNVLWRLMHGEMTPELNPKIWWLSLGMNDLARMQCSEEVAVMGILRVVEELLNAKPDAQIVINSLFPMSQIRGALYPRITDYQDSFKKTGKAARTSNIALQVPGTRRRSLRLKNKNRAPAEQLTEEQAADVEDQNKEKAEGQKQWYKFGKNNRNKNGKIRKKDLVLQEQHRIHKRISDMKLPIWTSVQVVNRELKKFAEKTERVTFFDVTQIFTKRGENAQLILNSALISIKGHPTSTGFKLWEEAVSVQAVKIVEDMKQGNPDIFDNANYDENLSFGDFTDFENLQPDDDFTDDAFAMGDDFSMGDDALPKLPEGGGNPSTATPPDGGN